jgi:hypothetical protein
MHAMVLVVMPVREQEMGFASPLDKTKAGYPPVKGFLA